MNEQFTPFLTVHKSPSFTEVEMDLWSVEVHFRETERDLKFVYADADKAVAIAKRIADKTHEKVLRREDIEKDEVRFDTYSPGNYKLVWYKKVIHNGRPAFIAMKDYVSVQKVQTSTVVLFPGGNPPP